MSHSHNPNPAEPYSTSSRPPRILIIRPSALGDVSRTVPVLTMIRNAHPDATIHWLVNKGFEDVIRHHPALDEVIHFDRKKLGRIGNFSHLMSFAKQLKRNHYDIVFDLQGLARSGLFTYLTRAKRRIGYANAQELAFLGYNEKYKIDRGLHTVDRMIDLATAAGLTPGYDLQLYVGQSDRDWLNQYLAEQNWQPGPYVCLAPTARWMCKCWPIENYIELAKRIITHNLANRRIIVLAGPNEHQSIKPLIDALGQNVLLPRTTVGQMMAILENTSLLVCNDSAPLHIAVGLSRPVVTIFGPTNPSLVGPYGQDYQHSIIQPPGIKPLSISEYRKQRDDQSLIAQIDVDTVWNRLLEISGK